MEMKEFALVGGREQERDQVKTRQDKNYCMAQGCVRKQQGTVKARAIQVGEVWRVKQGGCVRDEMRETLRSGM